MAEQGCSFRQQKSASGLDLGLTLSMNTVAYTAFSGELLETTNKTNSSSNTDSHEEPPLGYGNPCRCSYGGPYEEDDRGDVPVASLSTSSTISVLDPRQESRNELGQIMSAGSHISSKILDICTIANQNTIRMNKEDRCRLQFLKDTILLILGYISNLPEETKEEVAFVFYAKILSKRMMDSVKMINKIANFSAAMTPNFDIFELILRSQYDEMKSLFPGQIHPDPAELIVDPKARNAWRTHFPRQSYYVKFEDFLLMLRKESVFDEEPSVDLVRYLRYFVNFPNEDAVTPYKWNWLLNLFGPFESFSTTFTNIVTKRGFLGLINRIQAFEILTMVHQPRCYLIRLSRTEPQFLAFSYRNSEGHIGHQINKDASGKPIPVEQFIQSKFPKYEPVQKTLNLDLIFEIDSQKSLVEYASYPSGYIV